ncbi:ATP adenylyltransferase family protein [Roseofilum casamattae]|uniref:Phosphorylase n=1 Tax=Roseofilum casamattae BLCC-M143 TaxID=3022442 RepID=A0ABT7BVN9_9CYAN|nr:hypothetical protein [Roseofilum casamattae]MDJ1183250.1 phosphorylase [Roseofilum casamattae BLCC-M143]
MQASPPLFTSGTLLEQIDRQTQHALECSALRPLQTDYEVVEEGGIPFVVRVVSNLARKAAEKRKQERSQQLGKPANPFLPCDRDLVVCDLLPSHRCVLNKFNVVSRHILIVTREFESQENWLTLADFQALWLALAEIDGLGFYNAGADAGASQPHKHLQVVPLPLIPDGIAIPIAQKLDLKPAESAPYKSQELPFNHALVSFAPNLVNSPDNAARVSFDRYQELLRYLGYLETEQLGVRQTGAYNLLVTRRWMMLIPRSQDAYQSISVNSLGFAGALLVRNRDRLQQLKQIGLGNLLARVSRS